MTVGYSHGTKSLQHHGTVPSVDCTIAAHRHTGHTLSASPAPACQTMLVAPALASEVGTSDRTAIFDLPIAIGLRKNYRNISLAKPSDFKYRTSKTGLPIVR